MVNSVSPLGGKAASGAALMVAARFSTRLIDLAAMLVLTRILRPADFGLVAIAVSLVAMTEAVLELPLNQALLRLPVITRAHYDSAFTISLLRGVLMATLLVGTSVPFAHWYGDGRLIALVCVLSVGPAARGLASPRMAEFQKNMSFWRDFAIEITGKLISFVCCTSVALLTHSYWALAVGSVLYSVAMTVQSYRFAPYRPRIGFSEMAVFYEFAGWITIAQILSAVNWQFERLLLGKIRPMAQVGLFATASDIANIPFLAMFGPMARPLLAAFAHVQEDKARLASSYQKASIAMVAVGLPLLVGESLVAEPTVRLVLGQKWLAAAPLVRWLALSMTPALFTLPTMSLLMASGRTVVVLRRNALEFSIKLPVAVAGALAYGFPGVIAARFLSELVADLFCMIAVRSITGLSVRRQAAGWMRSLFATCVMTAVVVPVGRMTAGGPDLGSALVTLLACGAAGATTYVIAMMLSWLAAGSPDGLEMMVMRTASRLGVRFRLGRA